MSAPQAFAFGPGDSAPRTGRQIIEDMRMPVDEFPTGLDKIRGAMQAAEDLEAAKAAAERYNRQAQAEAHQMHQLMQDRVDIARMGRTTREIEAEAAEREQIRQAKVAELVDQLAMLDPARYGKLARSAGGDQFYTLADGSVVRMDPGPVDRVYRQRSFEEQLRRGREAGRDEFMLSEVVKFDRRQAERQNAIRRAEIADFEREYYPEIVR